MNKPNSKVLENIPFLRHLPSEALKKIFGQLVSKSFKFGELIVKSGDTADTFFIMEEGNARVISKHTDGSEISINTLNPGDYFGEMGLLRAGVRTKTVRAASRVKVLTLNRKEFDNFLIKYPQFKEYIELQVTNRTISNFLKLYTSLGTIPAAALKEILENLKLVTFKGEEIIINENDNPGPLFIIEEGHCQVYQLRDNKEINLGFLRQGDFFGELSLLKRDKRTATVRAVNDCTLYSLSSSVFRKVVDQYPEFHSVINKRVESYQSGISSDRMPLDFAKIIEHDNKKDNYSDDENDLLSQHELMFFKVKSSHAKSRIKMNRFPFVRQIDEADCGVAAFNMICRYYGCKVSLPYIRELTHTSIEGTTLNDICRAANEIGFDAMAVKVSGRNMDQLNLPAIIHWQNNHWVVLISQNKQQMQIADPAKRIHWINRDEFENSWTGYAIEFGNDPKTLKIIPEKSPIKKWILHIFGSIKWDVINILFLTILITGLQLAFPILTQKIVDDVINMHDPKNLNYFIASLGGILAVTLVLTIFQRFTLSKAAAKLDSSILRFIIHKMLSLPMSYFLKRSPEDIQRRLEGATEIRHFVVHSAIGGLIALVQIMAFVGLMTFYSLRMTQIFLILVPIYVGLMYFSAKILKPAFDDIQENEAKYRMLQKDIVNGIQTVKAAAAEGSFRDIVLKNFSQLSRNQSLSKFNIYCYDGTIQTLGFLSTILLLWIGAQLVLYDQLSMGAFIAFQMLTTMCYFPILTILNMWEDLQLSTVLLNRLNDIIDSTSEQTLEKNISPVTTLQGKVEFRNVLYSYGGIDSPRILTDISFSAHPGQLIAIVGKSQSGKSTLASSIAGLMQPSSGEILYDDVQVSSLKLNSLRKYMGLVLQHDHIFSGSIVENIALGDPNPNSDRIIHAATIANAHQFVQRLPNKYYTQISDSDLVLSRGQKQSISIARAIYRDPAIFILDEAFNSMDIEFGQTILSNLENIRQRCTMFIVTHRLESISHANLILVLDNGRITEQGVHADLMKRRGLYYQLYNA